MNTDAMSRLHGHIVRFCVINGIFLLILLLTGFGAPVSSLSLLALLATALIIPIGVVSIIMLYRKSEGGLNVAIANLALTGSLLLLIGILGLYSYITGSKGSILLPIALTLLGVSTLRRIPTLRNDAYVAWYQSFSSSTTISSRDTEVLTMCPDCSSILAVIPSKISPTDLCPNSGNKLVSIEEE